MGDMTVDELKSKKLWFLWSAKPAKNGKVTTIPFLANGGHFFGKKTIRSVKTLDAKLFRIKLQQEDGKSYSSIHTIRGENCFSDGGG